jgi:transposase InsO family protein
MGVRRTMHQLQRRAYWPGWQRDVRRYCQHCQECTTYHRGVPKRQGLLQPCLVGEPWERVAIDLTGPHPKSRSGHVFILTIIDLFTKWAEAIPIRNKEAITVARALFDVVFSRFGVPMQLLSDNGREFDNIVLKELCRLLEIDKIRTTVYKASTNGGIERFHRTLNTLLGKVVATNQRNWDECLPSVMGAYRASRHEATGYSPNFMMLGRENLAPIDVVLGLPAEEESLYVSSDEFVNNKLQMMREAYRFARETMGNRAERAKRTYDMRVRPSRYQVGQWTYYYSPRRYVGRSPKWQRMFTGPFLITKVMGPVNVQLQATKKAQPFIAHVDKLKKCLGPTPQSWLGVPEREEEAVELGSSPILMDVSRDESDGREEIPENTIGDDIRPRLSTEQEQSDERGGNRPRREIRRPARYNE